MVATDCEKTADRRSEPITMHCCTIYQKTVRYTSIVTIYHVAHALSIGTKIDDLG